MTRRLPTLARPRRGFSLIELLVSMAIGLILTLAITVVMTRAEGSKRSTTSVNDIDQTGNYVAYLLDRAIRNAGSGFSQAWKTNYGCLLNATNGVATIFPAPLSASNTPQFAGFTPPIRLAPVLIGQGMATHVSAGSTGGDVLMVMGGTAGVAELPIAVSPTGGITSTQLLVTNNLSYYLKYPTPSSNNIILLADPAAPACVLEEGGPSAGADPTLIDLNTAAPYYRTASLSSFTASTLVSQLGIETANPPQFQLFAVGANNALFSYDLLQPYLNNETQIADGVVEMRALYGVTNGTTTALDHWVDPGTAPYVAATLMDGSAASQQYLSQIVAIRIGFFLRTSLLEHAPSAGPNAATNAEGYVQPTTGLTLFTDLAPALQKTRTFAGSDRNYRWRTVEVTVPLLNVQNGTP